MEELSTIPWNLILPILILQLVLMVVALVDLARHRRANGPIIMWVLIVIFVGTVGPILYFIFGRRQS
ncbi:PLD nuclease N-terminal domain-containing protein [Sporosarcina oncorhynchi]|uniref:PLD nuclease N-terminal domain-containing protein n=1 Tax=Sporosarcina oncorhynchi TaxID=3056444 RepID=A0ABZ0L6N4_9BACL|nr:PLD nuclease N-terminal domain-containing protein [Sporosarcina sp. T2O-4]WOV87723.1 PLD nuclease N-terminal domain-containing protein [Sporosarcina sp. T2O-4]